MANLKINILAQDKTKGALRSVKGGLASIKNAVFSLKGAFVTLGTGVALRAIGNAIIADEILTYAPLIATILVYVGYAVVMSRNKARLGTHFGWL